VGGAASSETAVGSPANPEAAFAWEGELARGSARDADLVQQLLVVSLRVRWDLAAVLEPQLPQHVGSTFSLGTVSRADVSELPQHSPPQQHPFFRAKPKQYAFVRPFGQRHSKLGMPATSVVAAVSQTKTTKTNLRRR